jgi:hypothetical protein
MTGTGRGALHYSLNPASVLDGRLFDGSSTDPVVFPSDVPFTVRSADKEEDETWLMMAAEQRE